MSSFKARHDFLTSLRGLSPEERISRVISNLLTDEIASSHFLFYAGIFEDFAKSMSAPTLIKVLAPHLRELKDRSHLFFFAELIMASAFETATDGSAELIKLVKISSQILPHILHWIVQFDKASDTIDFFEFLVSSQWYSPFSKTTEIIHVLLMDKSLEPVNRGALMFEAVKRLEPEGYSEINLINLVIDSLKDVKCDAEDVERLFILALDAIILYCKKFGENILPYLVLMNQHIPSGLYGIFALLISVLSLCETSSRVLCAGTLEMAMYNSSSNPFISLAIFLLGLSDAVPSIEPYIFSEYSDLIFQVESDELKVLLSIDPSCEISGTDSTPFIIATSNLLGLYGIITDPNFNFHSVITDFDDELSMKLYLWLLQNRTGRIHEIVASLADFGLLNDLCTRFTAEVVSSLLQSKHIASQLLPRLCKLLPEHPFLFPGIQIGLHGLMEEDHASLDLIAAVCIHRIAAADNRQGHLHFAFSCIKRLLKKDPLASNTNGLLIESLHRLIAIRYIDPKTTWRSVIPKTFFTRSKDEPLLLGLLSRIASTAILSNKLAYDEPIPEEIMVQFSFVKEALFGLRDTHSLELAAGAMSALDPLYFKGSYPTAMEVLELLNKLEAPLISSHSMFALLKKLMGKEISDMPRSLFLGTASTSNASTSRNTDFDAMAPVECKILNEWKMVPYLLEPYLLLQAEKIRHVERQSVEGVEQILNELTNMTSMLQLHWSTRLTIFEPLVTLVHDAFVYLNASGRMNKILEELGGRLRSIMDNPSSPASMANALLLLTAVELARASIAEDDRYLNMIQMIVKLTGRYTDTEEVETAIIISLWKLFSKSKNEKAKLVLLNRLKTSNNSTWLKLLSSHVLDQVDQSATDIYSITASNSTCIDIKVLKELLNKNQLGPEDVQCIQANVVMASNKSALTVDELEVLKSLHPKVLVSEPVDLKNLFSISLSKAATKMDPEEAEMWLKHLISRLEKPAPALIKADAAIALNRLLFVSQNEIVARVPASFWSSTLPTLISATTDSRVNSWYILLMTNYHCHGARAVSAAVSASADTRFHGTVFGCVVETLMTTNSPTRTQNLLSCLCALKILPRFNWLPVLERLPSSKSLLALISSHVVAPLATGGHYVSPSLYKCLLGLIDSLDVPGISFLADSLAPAILHLEKSQQSEFLTQLIIRASGFYQCRLAVMKLANGLLEKGMERFEVAESLLLSLLPAVPTGSVEDYRALFKLASRLLNVDEMSESSLKTYLKLMRIFENFDMNALVELLQIEDLYAPLWLQSAALELVGSVPEDKTVDLFVKCLEICLVNPAVEPYVCRLLRILSVLCIDKAHRQIFLPTSHQEYFTQMTVSCDIPLSDELVSLCYRHFEQTRMSHEDWKRMRKRLARLESRFWAPFKSEPNLLSSILNP